MEDWSPNHWTTREFPGLYSKGNKATEFLNIFMYLHWIFTVAREVLNLPCSTQDLLVVACGIEFPDQGLNPCPLNWEYGVLPAGPPGKSVMENF